MKVREREAGAASPLLISNIIIAIIAAALAGVAIWAYANYTDQKNNVDAKIEAAVAEAKKQQSAVDEAEFLERDKLPNREFIGPSDLGSVTFKYPKTWSVHVANDGNRGKFEAYLHPGSVPPIAKDRPYALRVEIDNTSYDRVLKSFSRQVSEGTLKSSPVKVGDFSGIRLDGSFTEQRKGSAVVFKVRDKTLIVSSDSESFLGDFSNTILKTLSFKP